MLFLNQVELAGTGKARPFSAASLMHPGRRDSSKLISLGNFGAAALSVTQVADLVEYLKSL